MTDIQRILNQSGVKYKDTPQYEIHRCAEIDKKYTQELRQKDKLRSLIDHDVWALKYADERGLEGENWVILTYDKAMIAVGRSDDFKAWVTAPDTFLDLTQSSKPLADTKYVAMLHQAATYSERSLSACARILDRVAQFANDETIQNWEFIRDLQEFKLNILAHADFEDENFTEEVDAPTLEFLRSKGIPIDQKI